MAAQEVHVLNGSTVSGTSTYQERSLPKVQIGKGESSHGRCRYVVNSDVDDNSRVSKAVGIGVCRRQEYHAILFVQASLKDPKKKTAIE
jgi:hypothetical protein